MRELSMSRQFDYAIFDKIIVENNADDENRLPLFCPICDLVMNRPGDITSFENFSCCSECSMIWAESRREEWSNGWRPSKEDVEKEVQIRKRAPLSIQF